jgi:D-psicose/D-tagatose/L-ribulose 3-epimerase
VPEENKLGVHALVWTGSFDAESVRYACAGTAEAGFDLLEVPLLDPSEIDPEVLVPELTRAGLAPTCSLGLAPATDISATDLAVVGQGADLLRDALDVTVAIGSGYLGGPLYSALTKYTEPPTAAGRANAVDVLRTLAQEAAGHGVLVGLEVVNRYESNLVNTVADALRLVDDIGSDAVCVHVDTYHANIEEEDLAGAVRQAAAAGRLGYVHVGESHRGALGTGSVAWNPLFDALVDVGYDGPVVFESFSSAVVSPRFAAALGVWRELWDDSAALARHANDFVRAGLAAARQRAAADE